MAIMAAGQAAKNMTPTQKYIIAGGVVLVLGISAFATYKIYKGITGSKADDDNAEMGTNLKNLSVNKSELTISTDTAVMMAQSIFDAMNQRGTDEPSILTQLDKLKSQSDLLYVIKSFGVKNYGMSGESDSWVAKKLG